MNAIVVFLLKVDKMVVPVQSVLKKSSWAWRLT